MQRPALPSISVVIPAYRAARTILRAMESLLVQSELAELIVVVDGPGDDTAAIVRAKEDPRVRLVEQPINLGAQRTRNAGLALASSNLVMFLDADDFHEGLVLHGLATAMVENGADVCFAPMQIARGSTGLREATFKPEWRSASDLFQQWFVQRRYVAPAGVLWRTDYLRALGGWDECVERNQDGELVIHAALVGARIATSHEGRAVYVRDGGDTVSNRQDNLGGLLYVSDKVLATQSCAIDAATRQTACALHDYQIAWDCFERGADELGKRALNRSRELGFRGHRGPLAHWLLAQLVGLRRKCLVVDALKRLTGRPTKRPTLA